MDLLAIAAVLGGLWFVIRLVRGPREGSGFLIEDIEPAVLRRRLREISATDPPDPEAVADSVPSTAIDRYDSFLPADLRWQNYALAKLDTVQTWEVLRRIA